MRRLIAWLTVPILLLCLTACSGRSGSVTPGNISDATREPYEPPTNENAADVSGDYRKALCSYPWLDTYSMEYYLFAEDGSYTHYEDEELKTQNGSGSWKILKNEAGQLTLHVEVTGGQPFDIYELELYEESIYGRGLDDFIFIWLLAEPEE